MCIIVYKPIGVKMPSRSRLEYCWQNNPHGAGFMFADGDTIRYQKGFMTFRAFYKALKKHGKIDHLPVLMHFRIATHGGQSKSMTHPFEVTTSEKRLKSTSGFCSLAVMHNGILSMTAGKATASLSDTAVFARDVLTRLCRKTTYYRDTKIMDIVRECIGTSRLAILSADGHVETVGKWYTENGVKYSNNGFKPIITTCKSKAHADYWRDTCEPCDTCERLTCYKCDYYHDTIEREYQYLTSYEDTYLNY